MCISNFYLSKIILSLVFFPFLFPSCCFSAHSPVCNLSQTNVFFVGREEHLQQIQNFFKKNDKIILAITGAPGFGKSQIAKKYAHTHHKDYDFIWWFDAQQDIPGQFEKLALALNTLLPPKERIVPSQLSKEALVDTIKNILRVQKIRYLLIFDNPAIYTQVDPYIPPLHSPSHKHVILTSRNANIWLDKIEVGEFKREESLCVIKAAKLQEKEEDKVKLAEALYDYPLGLSLALSFIKSHHTVTIDKYIAMHVKRSLKEIKVPPGTLLDHYPKGALGALNISLHYIEKESKDSLQALFFMSLLNSKDIPEAYIEMWLKKAKSDLTADEAIKHASDQSLIGVSETIEFNANEKSTGQARMYYLSIHDLIHQLINEQIPREEKSKLIETATDVMLDVFSGPSEVFTSKIAREPIHLLQAQKLCNNAKTIGYSSVRLIQLKICLFQCYMSSIRDFETAKIIQEEIEADLKAGRTPLPYYEAIFKYNKGFLEAIFTHYDQAIHYMKEALALLEASEKSPGEHKNEMLCSLTNLAQYYVMRGEIQKAELLISKGKEILQNSRSLISNCSFIYVFSLVLIDQGKFQEAKEVLNKAKEYPTLWADGPPIYHGILIQKTIALIKQNQLDKALKILKECEEETNKFFQGRGNTALSYILLLKSLIEVSKKQISPTTIQNLEKALLIFNDFHQGEKKQRRQAYTYFVLGKAYDLKQDFKKALENYLASDEIYNKVLKEKKIDEVSELYKGLAILGVQLKDKELTYKYLKAHTQIFGLIHPRTKEIFYYLDPKKLSPP